MLSYHNDPAVKAKYVTRFAEHRAADAVIQGQGYEDGRGCFVGCTLENYDHELFPIELGVPVWLARLADTIFEGLPKKEAPQFGTDLLDAVPIGVDLEQVRVPFLIAVQMGNLARLEGNTEPYADQCRAAIQGVVDFLKTNFENDESAARSAESAARSAESAARSAWSAARSAWSAARSAESAESAESAAWSAARSAESAAGSAAWSAARSAARSAESQKQRDVLLALLRNLTVPA